MDDGKRETVVVDNGHRSNPVGWIVGLIVLIILILIFFGTGGFGLFGGDTTMDGGSDTINAYIVNS